MKVKRFLSLPVLAVFSLMAFVYYFTIFVFLADWVGLHSSLGTLNAFIFTLLASLCLFSFVVSVLTDPGHVPYSYFPDVEGRGIAGHVNGRDSVEQKRCDKCFTYKPPRTHHCRVCRRCVLKMDHHCMWINNCVGYRNYKAFFVLALYASIASIHSMVIFINFELRKDWESYNGSSLKIYYLLGSNMLKLLWPTAVSHLKDGVSFPTLFQPSRVHLDGLSTDKNNAYTEFSDKFLDQVTKCCPPTGNSPS